MRLHTMGLIGIAALALGGAVRAQNNPFAGAWNITPEAPATGVYWLEVKDEGGKPAAVFLNRGGSPVPAQDVKISGDELTFMVGGTSQNRPTVTLRAAGNKITGTVGQVKVAGERPPTWGACDANGSQALGKPVTLFDGKSLDAWGIQIKDRPIGWAIEEGVMTNQPKANNLVSKEKFRDFRLDAEYKLSEKGNSGIYLRGRYEVQIEDSIPAQPQNDLLGSVYGFLAPSEIANRKADEWQSYDITLLGRMVTIVLNGKTVIANQEIPGITGGALDSNEGAPGPLMLQGDHGPVEYRNIVLTPVREVPAR